MRTESLLGTVAFLLIALLVGCTTTRTLPDGTVEVEQLDPVALQAFVQLAQAALETAVSMHDDSNPVEEEQQNNAAEDILAMAQLAQAAQLLLADGVTAEELESLQDLYEQAEVILERNGVHLKLKVNK